MARNHRVVPQAHAHLSTSRALMTVAIVNKTVAFVKDTLASNDGGHDWWHIYRVWQLAKHIAKQEQANQNSQGPTLNHFYEKILLLKDGMHTNTAKTIAHHRHQFVKTYLTQFLAEWNLER